MADVSRAGHSSATGAAAAADDGSETGAGVNADDGGGIVLCPSSTLVERGRAHVWSVCLRGEPVTAFALRFEGRVQAYINRCAHVAAEMDWNVGEFLDQERRHIVCSLHGASYHPDSGRCAGGPCGRSALLRVRVREHLDRVAWYPEPAIQPIDVGP